jgi:hypothetical protein
MGYLLNVAIVDDKFGTSWIAVVVCLLSVNSVVFLDAIHFHLTG